ncbi:hypothetical protein ACIRU8_43015 [Streptomyces sp. NPDC101175]|uniref:hypothetical protein n=1 Tax=Streptomyces sp. NPDC101175 TaxID=3366123 RepID=UPI003832A1CF
MGKASRGKKEHSRDKADEWTATGAARAARRLREQTGRLLAGNPWVQTMLASNINNVVRELSAVLLHSDLADMSDRPEDTAQDAAWPAPRRRKSRTRRRTGPR